MGRMASSLCLSITQFVFGKKNMGLEQRRHVQREEEEGGGGGGGGEEEEEEAVSGWEVQRRTRSREVD